MRTARKQLGPSALHAKPAPAEQLTSPGHAATSTEKQAGRLGATVLGGYLEQTAPEAKDNSPEQISDPGSEDAPLNYAYMIQWWLFAAGVPVGWWVLVRRERRDREEAAAKEQAEEAEPAAV